MPPKAIIFGLGETLADTLPLCIRAFRQSIEPLIDRALSDQEIVATFGPLEKGTMMALPLDYYDQGIAGYYIFVMNTIICVPILLMALQNY